MSFLGFESGIGGLAVTTAMYLTGRKRQKAELNPNLSRKQFGNESPAQRQTRVAKREGTTMV
jgi:hypothetical protein